MNNPCKSFPWLEYAGLDQTIHVQYGSLLGWEFARARGTVCPPCGADLDEIAMLIFGPDQAVIELRNLPTRVDDDFHPFDTWLWSPLVQLIPMPPASLNESNCSKFQVKFAAPGENDRGEGMFSIQSPTTEGETLAIHVGIAHGWEYASVSTQYRCPSWEEMAFVKSELWHPEACVVE